MRPIEAETVFAEKTVELSVSALRSENKLRTLPVAPEAAGSSPAAESLCPKRRNHFVENPLSKAFIKRGVTLQPSEEQRTTKHIDQQFWIGRRLEFA
jgi:hypothetical protein